jgi:Aspartate/tyrosine/aromatic aminotransferase
VPNRHCWPKAAWSPCHQRPELGKPPCAVESAGFPVQNYRYYDAPSNDVNRAGMLEDLNALPSGSIVVLHACCHNPTGVDLTLDD